MHRRFWVSMKPMLWQNLVGQAVIVVEENKTKLADIENAVSQLDKKLAIGFLVNKSRGSYRDYYGYGYYYNRDRK